MKTGLDKPSPSCLTLEYGSVLDDESLELSADNLQAGLHVAARGYLIALLHFLGTAGGAFGLADLQISTWQRIGREADISRTSPQISIAGNLRKIASVTMEPIISRLVGL